MRPAALLLIVTALATFTVPASAAPPTRDYVALGDSYAAGPGIPIQNSTPPGCARSDQNYPAQLARWLNVDTFQDVSCSGATTVHMTAPQQVAGGPNPAQFAALSPKTDLVTLTIGGNDIGFGEILARCGQEGAQDPTGNPCQRYYTRSGRDVLADRVAAVAPKIAQALDGIKKRSPHAKILVVGYLRILPPHTGCWPAVPFAAGDTAYFDGVERALNATIATTTHAAGAHFVDPYYFSLNRDACQPRDRRWVEPLQPANPATPIHPNAAGMRVVAGLTWATHFLTR